MPSSSHHSKQGGEDVGNTEEAGAPICKEIEVIREQGVYQTISVDYKGSDQRKVEALHDYSLFTTALLATLGVTPAMITEIDRHAYCPGYSGDLAWSFRSVLHKMPGCEKLLEAITQINQKYSYLAMQGVIDAQDDETSESHAIEIRASTGTHDHRYIGGYISDDVTRCTTFTDIWGNNMIKTSASSDSTSVLAEDTENSTAPTIEEDISCGGSIRETETDTDEEYVFVEI